MNHPRRKQLAYSVQALGWVAVSMVLAVPAVVAALAGDAVLGVAGAVACASAIVLALRARDRARRNRIGADAERDVARRLDDFARGRGWRVEHGLRWQGPGDIDHLVASPGGTRFAIETKTLRYEREHLDRLRRAAASSAAQPVLCIARTRRTCRVENGVSVVSLDRLTEELAARVG